MSSLAQATSDFISAFLLLFQMNHYMKKEKNFWVLTFFVAISLLPEVAFAQQDSVRQLDELVITATRSEQPIIQVPRSVTVIDRREFERMPYNSVGELLANHPGMFVMGATQTPGTNQSLFMRGANSNQVVVLVDGTRITDPSSPSSAIDLTELSLIDVERIEVIRGAHSTMFGGAAIGGAINIITRRADQKGIHGQADLQAGTFGKKSFTGSANLALRYATENGLYVNAAVIEQRVRGLNATLDTIRTSGVFRTSDNDDFLKRDASVKVGFDKNKWNSFVSYKRIDQKADIDDGAFNDDDNAFVAFERDVIGYQAMYKANEDMRLTFLGSWSKSYRENENDSSIVDYDGTYDHNFSSSKYYGDLFTNELLFNYSLDDVKATAGVGRFSEGMNFDTWYFSNAFGFPYQSRVNYDTLDTRTNTTYGFLQLMYERKNFGVSAGTRFSRHSRFGNNWTFEISPSYRIEDMLLYASMSSGFNAPSLYQLYDPSQEPGSFTTRGNDALKPEKSLSFEVGVKKEFITGSYITASLFTSHTRNLIEYVYLWNSETPVTDLGFADYLGDTYVNIARQEIRGAEVSAHYRLGKFHIRGNLTWIGGKVSFATEDIDRTHTGNHHIQPYNYGSFVNTDVETEKMIRKPQLTGFAEAGFKPVNRVMITATWRHAGRRHDVVYDPSLGPFGALGRANVSQFNLFDFGTSWQPGAAWQFSLRIENVFDTAYQEIQGFQTRGRSAYLKAIFRW